jgi:predicted transcriptional regulator
MEQESKDQGLLTLTTEIVAAYAGHHTVATSDLPVLIAGVFQALRTAGQDEAEETGAPPVPAVPATDPAAKCRYHAA